MGIDPITNISWRARMLDPTDPRWLNLGDFEVIEITRGHRRMTIRIQDCRLCITADDRLTIRPVGSNWIDVEI